MREPLCYMNGRFLPLRAASLPLSDSAVLYGDGLFETVRIYGGKPFRLDQHLQRLEEGARYMEIAKPVTTARLRKISAELIEKNAIATGFLRLTLTRGAARTGLWPAGRPKEPTLLITVSRTIPYRSEQYDSGFRAAWMSFPRNERSPLTGLKTLNFLENILGRREAVRQGCQEGLFVNTRGEVAEGTTSNLFILLDNKLITPPPASGLLPGITRREIMSIAEEDGMAVCERAITPQEVCRAEEAFLTASLLEVMPVTHIQGMPIGTGRPGAVTARIRKLYRKSVQGGG